jgi:hypothetical protein
MRGRLAAIAFASVCAGAAALCACLPADESVERGAVYVHLRRVDAFAFEGFAIDRLLLLAGAAVPDCHTTYYVDRPKPPYGVYVLSLDEPLLFEHRSLRESQCGVTTGFLNVESAPVRGPGVTQAEYDEMYQPKITTVGAVHIYAHVVYDSFDHRFDKKFDIVLTGLRGGATAETDVPRGGHRELAFTFDTTDLAYAILATASRDVDGDGVVRTDELDTSSSVALKQKVAGAWRRDYVNEPELDAGDEPSPGSPFSR